MASLRFIMCSPSAALRRTSRDVTGDLADRLPEIWRGAIVSVYVVEDLGTSIYAFKDPDAFLSCDNPRCTQAWVTRTGLVAWSLTEECPCGSRFTDRVAVGCSADCLDAVMRERAYNGCRWSTPMAVGVWLAALRSSIDLDPAFTPIGEFAGTS